MRPKGTDAVYVTQNLGWGGSRRPRGGFERPGGRPAAAVPTALRDMQLLDMRRGAAAGGRDPQEPLIAGDSELRRFAEACSRDLGWGAGQTAGPLAHRRHTL